MVETAEKGRINFITNMIHQRSNQDDSRIHAEFKKGNKQRELEPEQVFTDSAYISGKNIKEYEEAGSELKGYIQKACLRKKVGFNLENFKINMKNYTATCPGNKKSDRHSRQRSTGYIKMFFKKADCQSCCNYNDCVGTGTKALSRCLHVNPYHDTIRKRRVEQKKPSFISEMSVRAQVEATISEAVRFHGLRKLKFRGEKGHKFQFLLVGAGLNLKRLLKAMTFGVYLH